MRVDKLTKCLSSFIMMRHIENRLYEHQVILCLSTLLFCIEDSVEKLNKRNILNTNFDLLKIRKIFRVSEAALVLKVYLVTSKRKLCFISGLV